MSASNDISIDVYQYSRDVWSTKLLVALIILGGPGIVVQIAESLFSHAQKVNLDHFNIAVCFLYLLF